MTLAPGIVEALADIVGRRYVCVASAAGEHEPIEVSSPWGELPNAVVFPATTDEVARVIRGASACRVRVLTQEGNVLCNGERGLIILAVSRLDSILEINTDRLYARVQPAVSETRLRQATAAVGMTIAGVPGTGPGWTNRANLLAIEVVTPGGRILREKRPATCGQAGLVDVLAELAGTMCVSTEVTLALTPRLTERPELAQI